MHDITPIPNVCNSRSADDLAVTKSAQVRPPKKKLGNLWAYLYPSLRVGVVWVVCLNLWLRVALARFYPVTAPLMIKGCAGQVGYGYLGCR